MAQSPRLRAHRRQDSTRNGLVPPQITGGFPLIWGHTQLCSGLILLALGSGSAVVPFAILGLKPQVSSCSVSILLVGPSLHLQLRVFVASVELGLGAGLGPHCPRWARAPAGLCPTLSGPGVSTWAAVLGCSVWMWGDAALGGGRAADCCACERGAPVSWMAKTTFSKTCFILRKCWQRRRFL